MSEHEDLRGRDFRWNDSGGEIHLFEEPIQIGRLVRVPDDRPVFFAEFVGRRWRIDHSVMTVGPVFSVSDPDIEATIGRSHYTPEVELRFLMNDRSYSLRRPSSNTTTWHDGSEDVVSFRWLAVGTGQAFVLMGAAPADAPALVLLGIAMASEDTLFLNPAAR